MMDVALWASVPFKNTTALLDFGGTIQDFFRAVADQTFALTGATIRRYPLGDPGGPLWLDAIQQQFISANTAVGLPPPGDLASYNLNEPEDHASFFFLMSQEARALRQQLGLT